MKIQSKKLNQLGVLSLHALLPIIAAVVVIGCVGGYVISKSSAAPKSLATGTLAFATPNQQFTLGSTVNINASYSGTRKQDRVRIQLICMQNGGVVYGDARDLTASPTTVSFTLGKASSTGSSVWTSGNASCRSSLFVVSPGAEIKYLADLYFESIN